MKICVFTGTRAEYGLLKPLMERIQIDASLQLSIIVSGAHLSERHGHTIDEIIEDGFTPDKLIPLPLDDDTSIGIAQATGEGIAEYAKALTEISPDLLLLLGDRYETFACATAAALTRIPIAHLHGGETTEGAVDEYLRHAITKMAHLHFTSCEQHRKRVIQLGEHPETVFNVGAIGVENIKTLQLLEKAELESDLNFSMDDNCLLATFHPVTLEEDDGTSQVEAFFSGMQIVMQETPTLRIILTGANADPGGSAIDALSDRFAKGNPDNVFTASSLGLLRYLSAMKHCAAVIGNSSSGILEAPSFGVPTVNIGNRQKGREQASSIFNCKPDAEAIATTLRHALSPSGRNVAKQTRSPYEKYGTSQRIIEEIKKRQPGVKKTFFDIPFRPSKNGHKE